MLLTGDVPIRFGAVTENSVATKSGTLESLSTIYDGFKVFAFLQEGNPSEDPEEHYVGAWQDLNTKLWIPNFMYSQTVEYDDGTGKWTYQPIKYWPNIIEDTVSFWGYSPEDAPVTLLSSAYPNPSYGQSTSGLPTIRFTVPSDPSDPPVASYDLLVSAFDMSDTDPYYPTYYVKDLSKQAVDETVKFLFRHALCKVAFTVQKENADYDIVLTELSINGLLNTGDLTGTSWAAGAATRVDYEILGDGDGDDKVLSTSASGSFPTPGYILLPQILYRSGATLEVKYKFKRTAAAEYTNYECSAPLGDILQAWEFGKQYTFSLKISPGNPILFVANVELWQEETLGYFNVNDE